MKGDLLIKILFIVLTFNMVNSMKEAIDFTYAQMQVTATEVHKEHIRLIPQRSILDRYQFPDTWEISQFLVQSIQKESKMPQMINFTQQIAFIKQQAGQYLKLSNKAELLVKNIKCKFFVYSKIELPQMRNDHLLAVRQEEFAVIEAHENKLNGLNDQINEKGVQLEKIVQQLMIQQENPLFKQAALNFEKKALTSKINLLNQLLNDARSNKKAQQRRDNQNQLNIYFQELNTIFKNQNGLIDAIDTLLKNHNQLTILKARVTSLTSQLKAHDLTLAEKQQCHAEFLKIKEKQHHDREVFKLIVTLKEKKHEFNEPNKYCQGVEKKLIDRIRRLLIGYDYVYECAQDLQHVRENRDRVKKQLEQAQKKLDQLQLTRGVQEFRRTFEHNRAVISTKIEELRTLKLDQFYRYPNSIVAAISESETRIAEIENLLENLPLKSSYDLDAIQDQIKRKVNEIQSLKAEYCKQNDLYNENAEIISNRITKLQQQQQYNSWIRTLQLEKYQQLETIKSEMKRIQSLLVQYLR